MVPRACPTRKLPPGLGQAITRHALSVWQASRLGRVACRARTGRRAEGLAEGRADILLRLLAKRFGAVPAAITRRIRSASASDLDRLIDRILDAESLREVLAIPKLGRPRRRASSSR